jgi:hypothetical protein
MDTRFTALAAKRFLALTFAALIAVAPALADQSSLSAPTTGSLPGLTMVNDYNSALNAINTANSGASAPSNQLSGGPSPGNYWLNTSTGALSMYDGTSWLTIGFLDTTNHIWTPIVGGNVATSVASATTTNLCGASGGAPTGAYLTVTGTVAITGLGSNCQVGQLKIVTFSGALQLTYNGTSLILPTGGNITTSAGDVGFFVYLGSGNWKLALYQAASGAPLVSAAYVAAPGGRLTLVSATPYMTPGAPTIGVSTIFYTPAQGGNQVPVYNGSVWAPTAFPEVSQSLSDTTRSVAAAVANAEYDEFGCVYSGSFVLVRSPAWTNATTPSLARTRKANGLTTNDSDLVNAASTVICPAGYGLYLGSVATDSGAATVSFNPAPAAASGGPSGGAQVNIWNEYNRRPIKAKIQDSESTTWTWTAASWHVVDAQPTNNVINFITGQAEDGISASYSGMTTGNTASHQVLFGVGLDSQTVAIAAAQPSWNYGSAFSNGTSSVNAAALPVLGAHALYPLEAGDGSIGSFVGSLTGPAAQVMNFTADLQY